MVEEDTNIILKIKGKPEKMLIFARFRARVCGLCAAHVRKTGPEDTALGREQDWGTESPRGPASTGTRHALGPERGRYVFLSFNK